MAQILSWSMAAACVTAACLTAGSMLLWRAAAAHLAGRHVRGRFHMLVAPPAPARTHRALAWLRRRATGDALSALQARLMQAGFSDPAAAPLFAALRIAAALAAFCLMLAPSWLARRPAAPQAAMAALFLGFVAYRACGVALTLRIEARRRAMRRELPSVLDLLLLVLEAGVSADQALHHVGGQCGRIAPAVAAQLARYRADTADGMPYDAALDRLAERLAVPEGRDFAGLLKQNLYQGGELVPPLRRLAEDLGEARLAAAREQTGRKAVLLTFVMLFFFMPVLMVILAGPAVSDLYQTLGRVAHHMTYERAKR